MNDGDGDDNDGIVGGNDDGNDNCGSDGSSDDLDTADGILNN